MIPVVAQFMMIVGVAVMIFAAAWEASPDATTFVAFSRSMKGLYVVPEDEGPLEDLIEIVSHIERKDEH